MEIMQLNSVPKVSVALDNGCIALVRILVPDTAHMPSMAECESNRAADEHIGAVAENEIIC